MPKQRGEPAGPRPLRGLHFVDKILKGADPRDLPVEQPTKFELAVNVETTKVLGITISSSIRVCADKGIE